MTERASSFDFRAVLCDNSLLDIEIFVRTDQILSHFSLIEMAASNQKKVMIWLDPPIKEDAENVYYDRIQIRTPSTAPYILTINIGDKVKVYSGPQVTYFAEIRELFENKKTGNKMFKGSWFYKPADARHISHSERVYYDSELLASNHMDLNPIASIISICYVLFLDKNQLLPIIPPEKAVELYFCRYSVHYDHKPRDIIDLTEEQILAELKMFPQRIPVDVKGALMAADSFFWEKYVKSVQRQYKSKLPREVLGYLNIAPKSSTMNTSSDDYFLDIPQTSSKKSTKELSQSNVQKVNELSDAVESRSGHITQTSSSSVFQLLPHPPAELTSALPSQSLPSVSSPPPPEPIQMHSKADLSEVISCPSIPAITSQIVPSVAPGQATDAVPQSFSPPPAENTGTSDLFQTSVENRTIVDVPELPSTSLSLPVQISSSEIPVLSADSNHSPPISSVNPQTNLNPPEPIPPLPLPWYPKQRLPELSTATGKSRAYRFSKLDPAKSNDELVLDLFQQHMKMASVSIDIENLTVKDLTTIDYQNLLAKVNHWRYRLKPKPPKKPIDGQVPPVPAVPNTLLPVLPSDNLSPDTLPPLPESDNLPPQPESGDPTPTSISPADNPANLPAGDQEADLYFSMALEEEGEGDNVGRNTRKRRRTKRSFMVSSEEEAVATFQQPNKSARVEEADEGFPANFPLWFSESEDDLLGRDLSSGSNFLSKLKKKKPAHHRKKPQTVGDVIKSSVGKAKSTSSKSEKSSVDGNGNGDGDNSSSDGYDEEDLADIPPLLSLPSSFSSSSSSNDPPSDRHRVLAEAAANRFQFDEAACPPATLSHYFLLATEEYLRIKLRRLQTISEKSLSGSRNSRNSLKGSGGSSASVAAQVTAPPPRLMSIYGQYAPLVDGSVLVFRGDLQEVLLDCLVQSNYSIPTAIKSLSEAIGARLTAWSIEEQRNIHIFLCSKQARQFQKLKRFLPKKKLKDILDYISK